MSGEFAPPPTFDVDTYLDERKMRDNFVLVELGHNAVPIARKQHNLTGGRTYIGIEAWTRDRKHSRYLQHLGDAAFKNTFFIDQYLHPDMEHATDRPSHNSEIFTEAYDPTTILPKGAADELFLGNVFGDPHVYAGHERPRMLLEETKRLLAPNGTLIVRETITPHFGVKNEELTGMGLHVVHRENYGSDESRWARLEAVFNGGNKWALVEPTSFYLFIRHNKTPADNNA